MACKEARAMLDALMGSDRNAPLPKGAAIPWNSGKKRKNGTDQYQQVLKRKKSCYDPDIDPIYTAWGVDVYDLFINTKSDIGTNPYIADKNAHEEYKQLSVYEREKLGYEHMLFHKLQDLVRQGDRMIARNKEKLKQELNRKLSQRNYQDFVQDVDMNAVQQLTRDMIVLEDLVHTFEEKLQDLYNVTAVEDERKKELEELFLLQKDVPPQVVAGNGDDVVVDLETSKNETTTSVIAIKEVPDAPNETAIAANDKNDDDDENDRTSNNIKMEKLQQELGQSTLKKQRLIYDIAQLMIQIVPQNDAVESQRRHLNYVKSDISTDKTVCEISGNNMSSRDADERIAAHYSGKQYIGWKLVRDKLAAMIQQYGRNGPKPPPPPPPSTTVPPLRNDTNMGRPSPMQQQQYNSYGSGSSRGGGRPPYDSGGGGRDTYGGGGYGGRGGGGGGRDNWSRPGGGDRRGGGGDVYNHDRQRYPPSGGDRGWRR